MLNLFTSSGFKLLKPLILLTVSVFLAKSSDSTLLSFACLLTATSATTPVIVEAAINPPTPISIPFFAFAI
ncbi:hypothetical protein JM47_02650 [Ureaplasma diversum]|uniref:Uncharacterized protein n=1 Tax=Ureaplasma diversum TaxID=42094 RepID=A0A0C5RM29_9BACT|nr:hypothetical protein [Ureaplasma diversum]AJQ45457.1 hypothetical protein JM47_02650 [Ureaplasma diversum]